MTLDADAPVSPASLPSVVDPGGRSTRLLPGVMPSVCSPVSGPRPRTILGPDNRQRVPTVSAPPWQMVCHLLIQNTAGRWFSGTGWLGGPSTVYTAGHNLWDAQAGHQAVRVWVVPGRDGDLGPHGQYEASGFEVHPQWRAQGAPDVDLGVVWLPQAVGSTLGWFGFSQQPDAVLQGLTVRTSGYPDDLPPFGSQWQTDASIHRASPRMLAYGLDTERGQSGSPVYVGDAQGRAVVVGVHVYGAARENLAVRIDAATFGTLSAWWR